MADLPKLESDYSRIEITILNLLIPLQSWLESDYSRIEIDVMGRWFCLQ